MKKLLILLLIIATGGGVAWYAHVHSSKAAEIRFRTVKVERGEVLEGVAASGAIQPFLLVQVGTQISGVIEKLFVDFNSKVKAGETVALLDSRRLVAQVLQDEASLGNARAGVEKAEALLWQAERDLERQKSLAEKKWISESDMDAAVATERSLRASLALAAAVVSQNIANLDGDLVTLRYATITSPVDGVIVSRNVDVGQTVAASLQAPTVFVIANDLTKIQVQASVPEADVGKIQEGQKAHFGVDAHPGQVFHGVVSQIRLASTTVQNVVTYTVLIDAANPKGLLLPGMTANATFEIEWSSKDTLKVPVAATRYQPSNDLLEPDAVAAIASANAGRGKRDREAKADGKPAGTRSGKPRIQRLYVKGPTGLLHPVRVRFGVTDGTSVAIEPVPGETLDEGADVVIGVAVEEEEQSTNPFAPRMPTGGRGGGGR